MSPEHVVLIALIIFVLAAEYWYRKGKRDGQ